MLIKLWSLHGQLIYYDSLIQVKMIVPSNAYLELIEH